MCNNDGHLFCLPQQLLKASSFPTNSFNCSMHALSIWKLDKNSSSVIYVPSWSIHSQLLFHVQYGLRNAYHDDFEMANLTTCNDQAHLQSCLLRQGKSANKPLLYGFWLWLLTMASKQICFFWELRHFGVVNYAAHRLVYPEVAKNKWLCEFGKWSPFMNKLTTPIIKSRPSFSRKYQAKFLSMTSANVQVSAGMFNAWLN